ncbi:MAG: AMED_5909 family protein [Pseudonocardiaceae bacterium]
MDKTVTRGLRTLMQAHEESVRIRPGGDAPLGVWLGYYERSVALYELIAKIDQFHAGEARYWAWRERRHAENIAARIGAERSGKE